MESDQLTDEQLERVLKKVLVGLEQRIDARLGGMRNEIAHLRESQVDRERELQSIMLAAGIAGRGGLLPREQNLQPDGHRFKTGRKDLKPSSIY